MCPQLAGLASKWLPLTPLDASLLHLSLAQGSLAFCGDLALSLRPQAAAEDPDATPSEQADTMRASARACSTCWLMLQGEPLTPLNVQGAHRASTPAPTMSASAGEWLSLPATKQHASIWLAQGLPWCMLCWLPQHARCLGSALRITAQGPPGLHRTVLRHCCWLSNCLRRPYCWRVCKPQSLIQSVASVAPAAVGPTRLGQVAMCSQ